MSISRIAAVSLLFLTIVSSLLVFGSSGAEGEDAIGSAEAAVVSAYGAALEAEEAGADVSILLEQLNAAAEHLALARMCSRRGEPEAAAGNASLCIEMTQTVSEEARVLRDRAVGERNEHAWMAICGSILGVVAAALGSLLGWGFFKKRYYRRVLRMKPEVREGEP